MSHEHHHHETSKNMLWRIIIAIVMTVMLQFLPETVAPLDGYLRFALFLLIYIFIGWNVIWEAFSGIFHGEVFDENFLMTVATAGVFGLAIHEGSGDYNEAISVMLFFQIGEYLQNYALEKSRKNISKLMDVSQMLTTTSSNARSERFITRFARYYTPIVCFGALVMAVVGMVMGWGIYRALTFLVISCPCALVISIPLAFFGGIGAASSKGILIKETYVIEELAKGHTRPDISNDKMDIAVRISRKTMNIVWQNIWFIIGVKVACLVLGAFGYAEMWLAVFADVGVLILAIINSIRAMRV